MKMSVFWGLSGGGGIGAGEGDENGSGVVCGLSGSGGVGNSNGACCVVDGNSGENDASNDLVSVVVMRCFRCLRTQSLLRTIVLLVDFFYQFGKVYMLLYLLLTYRWIFPQKRRFDAYFT